MGKPRYPSLYQINTRVWLTEHGGFTDADLDHVAGLGFDWVWLLGVWQTGSVGQAISRTHPQWQNEYHALLADFREEDVCGSPFAVQAYRVHTDFGGDDVLERLRDRLAARGLKLLLDFVPNHTAPDHPWVWEHPEYYVRGTDANLAAEPHNFRRVETSRGPLVLAHGRDPYFPGWPDTLQLNYRHAGLREAMTQELLDIARRCDGIRCDMAMLLLPDVIQRTWGDKALPADGTRPVHTPFWPEAIARVRAERPDFLFMAEVYWDLEWQLQQQGFDYTYDKRLYDRLHVRDAEAVRAHERAGLDFQQKLVRFLENHDEPRAAGAFPPCVHKAAAVATYCVPGLHFFHEGQLEGRRVKASVHLARRPAEPVDETLRTFYQRLLKCLQRTELRNGDWKLLDCRPAWDENRTWNQFLAYWWDDPRGRLLVAINYGPTQGQCYVGLPPAGFPGRTFLLRDLMSDVRYERAGDELAARGLYLDITEWCYHVFEITPA